jgi:hypothetical protein
MAKHSIERSTIPQVAKQEHGQAWARGRVVTTGQASYEALCKRMANLRQEEDKDVIKTRNM